MKSNIHFLTIFRRIFLIMKNVSDNICTEMTHILFSIIFSPKIRDVYEMMWIDMIKTERS